MKSPIICSYSFAVDSDMDAGFNKNRLHELFGDDAQSVHKLLNLFLLQLNSSWLSLSNEELRISEWPTVLHDLKGSASFLGCKVLMDEVESVEKSLSTWTQRPDPQSRQRAIETIKTTIQKIEMHLGNAPVH